MHHDPSSQPGYGRSFTQYEKLGINAPLNLSDAHARQPHTQSQMRIIAKLDSLFELAAGTSQELCESRFVDRFMALAGQQKVGDYGRHLLSYAASCGIDMVALHCMENQFTVGLIEPCFDNISNYLRRRHVPIVAIFEERLYDDIQKASAGLDAMWIVAPNNPTGRALTEEQFEMIAKHCAYHDILLICDFCFRFFSDQMLLYDQYRILERAGTRYVAIEDTGKTWPTLDVKCSIMTCSDELHHEFYAKHDDLLLNVSPFVLTMIGEFIDDSSRKGLSNTVRSTVLANRQACMAELAQSEGVACRNADTNFPLLWLELSGNSGVAHRVYEELSVKGVHVLPGYNFFFSDTRKNKEFVRIALNRSPQIIKRALPAIVDVVSRIS